MLNKAIQKIKTEINGNKGNPYIQVVGEFLLQHLQDNPINAEKIIQEEKTIGKSLVEMKKVADKNRVGYCAVLTDQEGFSIVLKYFGIEGAAPSIIQKPKEDIQTPEIDEFNIELDF